MTGQKPGQRGFSKGGNEQQKALAVIFVLFMALLYKQMYWDQYFHPQPQVPAVQPAPTPKPVDTSSTENYDEPLQVPASRDGAAQAPASDVTAKAPESVDALPAPGVIPQGFPTDGQLRAAGIITVQTKVYRAELSLLGGRLRQFLLNEYKETLQAPEKKLDMVEHVEKAPLPLGIYSGAMNDAWVRYEVVSGATGDPASGLSVNLSAEGKAELMLRGTLRDGRTLTKTIRFDDGSYLLEVTAELSAPASDSSRLSLEWTKLIPKDSPRLLDPYQDSSYVWFDGQKALRSEIAKIPGDAVELPAVRWVSLSDKYFMAALISPDQPADARVLRSGQLFRERLNGGETRLRSLLFIGPKNLELLEKAGFELKRDINFGRFAVIAAPLASLLHLLFKIFGNYGLAIVVLTILVKICLYPLTASSYKQMKAMQDLAPEMQKIKESVADKQQQQLAMMELYKKKNVNPLGGCLPMLLQMPVFFGLFSALQLSIELRHAPFAFWIHDLSAPEKLMIGGFALPVMVVLFVISMLLQQWTTPTTMDATQKRVMLVMPLVFGFMFANMPAGLTLYWLTNNVISICQQVGLRKGSAKSAFQLTAMASVGTFLLAFIIVKLSQP